MFDILNRPINLGDLVIASNAYYLVLSDNTLFKAEDKIKYPTIINNVEWPVVKVTNYDEEEKKVKEFLESAYMNYKQSTMSTNSDNIQIGDIFKQGITYYIYMGMATLNSTWEDNGRKSDSKRVHTFYEIGDFCEAKNVIFKHRGLDIDFLLQYTSPQFKTCKDLNNFLSKLMKVDSFYVTDNSFNNRVFKKSQTKNGNYVLVTNELVFDMMNK